MDPGANGATRHFVRTALAGAAAACAGNGIARFAYVPIFPAMVTAGWVDGGQAGLLGAGALAGYLAGILAGRATARRLGVPATLDLGMAQAASERTTSAMPRSSVAGTPRRRAVARPARMPAR